MINYWSKWIGDWVDLKYGDYIIYVCMSKHVTMYLVEYSACGPIEKWHIKNGQEQMIIGSLLWYN